MKVYCLRIRSDDESPWGNTEYYLSKKERNHDEVMNRYLGGIRTHSFEEQKTKEELEQLAEEGVLVHD